MQSKEQLLERLSAERRLIAGYPDIFIPEIYALDQVVETITKCTDLPETLAKLTKGLQMENVIRWDYLFKLSFLINKEVA